MGFAFGWGFNMFGIMFTIMFMFVMGVFIVTAIKGISQWNKNNNSPRLTVPAVVVSKRTEISHHHHNGVDHHHHHSSTTYYITFQVESGDRMEFHVTGQDYGMLIEGDEGMLHFQGTRYLGFQR